MITVRDIKEVDDYTLCLEDLYVGQIAQHRNGTIVIRTSGDCINLANGVGGYEDGSPEFKRLYNSVIEITTNGRAEVE